MASRILILLAGVLGLCNALQFCKTDESKGVNTCLGVTTAPSVFTKSTDTHFMIQTKFTDRKGWVSFGIGNAMADAVMFVLYPGINPDHITVSVRTAPGHALPVQDSRLPEIEIQSISNPEADVFNVYFICKTCDAVIPSFNAASTSQSFIWAANTQQRLGTGDRNASLEFHQYGLFGVFNLDMTKSRQPKGASLMPIIHSTSGTSSSNPLTVAQIHGLIASLSLLIFPIGVFLLRRGGRNSFKHHWMTQTCSIALLLLGSTLGLALSFQRNSISSIHQLLGSILTVAFSGQLYSGYMHHKMYMRHHARTKVSYIHIWAGRSAMFLGVLNVFLGCRLAMASYKTFAIFLAIWAVEGVVLLIPNLKTKRGLAADQMKYDALREFGSSEDTIAAEHEFSIEDEEEFVEERVVPKDGEKGGHH